MNRDELQRKLIAAARATPADERVPYAFEQRIMARLAELPPVDPWLVWSNALWRAAAPCVAVALFLGTWSAFLPEHSTVQETEAADLEGALIAQVQENTGNW